MGQPPEKKRKWENCIVCNAPSTDQSTSKHDKKYTNFLINQLIPSTEKHKFSCSTLFSFCMKCIGVLNNLMELQLNLEFLVKSIEDKKFELKCKIVQIKDNCGHTDVKDFREVATRSLYPKISKYSNNDLFSKKEKDGGGLLDNLFSGPETNTNTDEKEITIASVFPSPKTLEVEVGELRLNSQFADYKVVSTSNSKEEEVAPKTKCLKNQNEGYDKYAEDIILPSEYHEITENDPEIEIKQESQEIIDGEDEFQIHNWEELEEHNSEVPSSFDNSLTKCSNPPIVVLAQTVTLDCDPDKKWPKPMLTMRQICYLALLYPNANFKSSREMSNFVCENFPYFKSVKKTVLENHLKHTCENEEHFVRYIYPEKKESFFAVVGVGSPRFISEKEFIYKYLCTEDILTTMACPERVVEFQKALDPNVTFLDRIPTPPSHTLPQGYEEKICETLSTRKTPLKKGFRGPRTRGTSSTEKSLKGYLQNSETLLCSSNLKTVTVNARSFLETSEVNGQIQISTQNNSRCTISQSASSNKEIFDNFSKPNTTRDDVIIVSGSIAKDITRTPVTQNVPLGSVGRSTLTNAPFTCTEICVCAIMNAESMLVSVADVLKFSRENFPLFYDSNIPDHLCISNIESTLDTTQFRLITKATDALVADSLKNLDIEANPTETIYPFLYTVYDSPKSYYWRKGTAAALSSKYNLAAMAFPDRVYGFIENVLTRSIVPDACLYLFRNKQTLETTSINQ